MNERAGVLAVALAVLLPGPACGSRWSPAPDEPPALFSSLRETPAPAAAPSGQPMLAASSDGRVVLSWVERVDGGRHRLQYALADGDSWSAPQAAAEGRDWFVNWADVPSVVPMAGGRLAAHWLVRSGSDTYAYDVAVRLSTPGPTEWLAPIAPHADGTQTEHGFVSIFDWPEGGAGLVWLDGRNFAGHGGTHAGPEADMTLRAAVVAGDGSLGAEALLDSRTCECCPTAAAATAEGVIVAYRDRDEHEVRDIAVVRYEAGRWTDPAVVHQDGWQISGCPVNGPALAADGRRVALAWFTAAGNAARVRVAFSDDGGVSFGEPIDVQDEVALGRVSLVLLPDGSALAGWIEFSEAGSDFRVRRVRQDGRRDPSVVVTAISQERASGYPRMARRGRDVYFAWTDAGERPQVRTALGVLYDPTLHARQGTTRP